MSIDAFGEKQSVLFAEGEDNKMRTLWSQEFPHSLGSFYAAMTEFLGFEPGSDEWKVMGASSYGDSNRYYDKLRGLFHLKDDCGFELDLSYFAHYQFHRPSMYSPKLAELLRLQPNKRDHPLTEEYYGLAAAVQRVTEDVYFHLLNQLHALTKLDKVVLAGGVVYNSVANGKILERTPFSEVFISPVPDDSGGSLGGAYYLYHQVMGKPRTYVMTSNYFGPSYSNTEIEAQLKKYKIRYTVLKDPARTAAELVASGKIIGWFQGCLEFGDRALGNRSILADPRDQSMKDKVNDTVKYREPFRPFAPSILVEYIDDYFVDAVPTPFMEKVFSVREQKRSVIPAVTHIDGTGRIQSVSREHNQLFWQLINEFRKLTDVPVVLNTSFNLKGEPIVCSPQDALRTFVSSGLDALIIGDYLMEK
jgi:carbamoyltransferase